LFAKLNYTYTQMEYKLVPLEAEGSKE